MPNRANRTFYLPLYATYKADGELNTYNILELTLDCEFNSYLETQYNNDIKRRKVTLLALYSCAMTIYSVVQKRMITLVHGKIARGSLEAALCSYLFDSASDLGGEYSVRARGASDFSNMTYFNANGALLRGTASSIFVIGYSLPYDSTLDDVVKALQNAYYVDIKGNIARLSACPLPWTKFIFAQMLAGDPMLPYIANGLSELPGVKVQTDASCATLPVYLHAARTDNKAQQAARALMPQSNSYQRWFSIRKTVKNEEYSSAADVVTYELENATQLPMDAEQLSLNNVVAPLRVGPSVLSLALQGDVNAPILFPQEMGYFCARLNTLSVPLGNLPRIARAKRAEALATAFTLEIDEVKSQAFVDTMTIPDFAVEGKLRVKCKSQPCKTLVAPALYDGVIDMCIDKPQFQLYSTGTLMKVKKPVAKEHILRLTPVTESISLDLTREHIAYVLVTGTPNKSVSINAKLSKFCCYEDETDACTTVLYKNGGDLTIHMSRYAVTANSATYIHGKFNCLNIDHNRSYGGTNGVMRRHYYVNADVNYIAIDKNIMPQVVVHVKKGFMAQLLNRYDIVDPKLGDAIGMLEKKVNPAGGMGYFVLHPEEHINNLMQAQQMGSLVEDL